MTVIPYHGPTAPTVPRQKVNRECVFPDVDIGLLANPIIENPDNLPTRRIAVGMDDPMMTVSALSSQGKPIVDTIEFSPPGNQLGDSLRPF
jgi:hypothetical protein